MAGFVNYQRGNDAVMSLVPLAAENAGRTATLVSHNLFKLPCKGTGVDRAGMTASGETCSAMHVP